MFITFGLILSQNIPDPNNLSDDPHNSSNDPLMEQLLAHTAIYKRDDISKRKQGKSNVGPAAFITSQFMASDPDSYIERMLRQF